MDVDKTKARGRSKARKDKLALRQSYIKKNRSKRKFASGRVTHTEITRIS